jgi:hypothetical protein
MKRNLIILFATIFAVTVYAEPPESDRLTGTWVAIVEYNNSFDTYKINFTDNGRCTVKVSNDRAEQETTGNWSWDSSLFILDAVFRNAKLSYLQNIRWRSVLNFGVDDNSFVILGRTAANSPQSRITFYKQDSDDEEFNGKVIPQIFYTLSANIPARSRIAVVGITAANPNEAAFYLNELTLAFFNSRNYTVVERRDIDAVLTEQNFQLSGYVDDNAAAAIGKFTGAQVVVTGTVSGTGAQRQLTVKAIDVLTSELLSMAIGDLTR